MAQTEIEVSRRRGRAELIAALAEARSGITRDATDLGDLVNVRKRIRESIADPPLRRIAAAIAAGLISSNFLRRRRRRADGEERPGWFQRLIPELDFKAMVRLLLRCYLEPEEVELRAMIRERLREYLK